MPIELKVTEDRNIYIINQPDISSSNVIGVTGEKNATVLRFEFFEELNGELVSDFQKRLVAILPEGVLRYDLSGDFRLPTELTASEELTLLVEILKGDDILFKSYPHTFNMIDSGDNPETNLIQAAVDSTREDCRSELETSLETATGENQDGKTWDELNGTVAGLPVLKEEQTQALGDYDLIKEYFAEWDGQWHEIFTGGLSREYRLPYIYTPKLRWKKDRKAFSTNLIEVGIDVSSAETLGSTTAIKPFASSTLQRLVMTGNANAQHLKNFMSAAYELRYIKMETPSELVLTADPAYYFWAFYCCRKMQTLDCELDFTGQTDTTNMFTECFMLKDLRIKPFTLSTSMNFGHCRSLHHNDLRDYDSLISILNGITLDKEVAKNITLTFPNEITDITTDIMIGYWNCYVWWQDDGSYTLEEGNSIFAEPISLYNAFINKGVTIALV